MLPNVGPIKTSSFAVVEYTLKPIQVSKASLWVLTSSNKEKNVINLLNKTKNAVCA